MFSIRCQMLLYLLFLDGTVAVKYILKVGLFTLTLLGECISLYVGVVFTS